MGVLILPSKMKGILLSTLVISSLLALTEGGRLKRNTVVCKLANVPFISSLVKDPCNRYCQVAGHSGGSCQEDKCQCSAQPVSTYFCSEDHSEDAEDRRKACATYCHFKGKQTGTCNVDTGACECIEEELRAKHSVCIGPAEDNLCSIKCQTMDQAKSNNSNSNNNTTTQQHNNTTTQ